MSLVVNAFAPGALASYDDLIAAVRDQLDDAAYPQDAIDRAIRMAEAYFNRELRTPEMETQVEIAVVDELTPLPADFLSLRSIYEVQNRSFPLLSTSPSALVKLYGRQSGTPAAYAIEGRQLHVAPIGEATLELNYYSTVPALTPDTPTSWLLLNHPDLYLWGVLWYLCQRDKDGAGAAQALQAVSSILQSIEAAATRNRWGAGPLVPKGMSQVRSARA